MVFRSTIQRKQLTSCVQWVQQYMLLRKNCQLRRQISKNYGQLLVIKSMYSCNQIFQKLLLKYRKLATLIVDHYRLQSMQISERKHKKLLCLSIEISSYFRLLLHFRTCGLNPGVYCTYGLCTAVLFLCFSFRLRGLDTCLDILSRRRTCGPVSELTWSFRGSGKFRFLRTYFQTSWLFSTFLLSSATFQIYSNRDCVDSIYVGMSWSLDLSADVRV